MAYFTHSDEMYDNYDSWTNLLIRATIKQTKKSMENQFAHTDITARDSRGNITFHHRQRGVMKKYQIANELKKWAVDTSKETVEIVIA